MAKIVVLFIKWQNFLARTGKLSALTAIGANSKWMLIECTQHTFGHAHTHLFANIRHVSAVLNKMASQLAYRKQLNPEELIGVCMYANEMGPFTPKSIKIVWTNVSGFSIHLLTE